MTYLVGYSPHKGDGCALALACQLARSEAEPVQAVTVVPRGWATGLGSSDDGAFDAWAAAEGEASAREAAALLAEQADVVSSTTWVTGRSVPAELLARAEASGASVIVVGSGVEGVDGLARVTSKTDRLLHSSGVPVAIAPRGYSPEDGSRITRVTLAFRDDDESWALLDTVAEFCSRVGTELRLLTVALRQRTLVSSQVRDDEGAVFAELLEQVRAAQSEAVAHLADKGVRADTLVTQGGSWSDALACVPWSAGDVLLVGSSRTLPLATVFLGSSAAKIVRNSPVPVVVVP